MSEFEKWWEDNKYNHTTVTIHDYARSVYQAAERATAERCLKILRQSKIKDTAYDIAMAITKEFNL